LVQLTKKNAFKDCPKQLYDKSKASQLTVPDDSTSRCTAGSGSIFLSMNRKNYKSSVN